jgi:hypothetical protein
MQYRSMFQDNEHMKKILVWIYEDILKFHLRALRVFTQPGAAHHLVNQLSANQRQRGGNSSMPRGKTSKKAPNQSWMI